MRYTKQILFDKIGKKGQRRIEKNTVCIVGVGATGSTCANLLCRAGVGKLVLIDRDVVELDNLQRQTLYEERDVFFPKATCAKDHLLKINSEVVIKAIVDDLNFENIERYLKGGDIVIDCTDNFETRFLLNDYCVKYKKPFVYTGVLGDLGACAIFKGSPCFRCVFLEPNVALETCDNFGVINSAVSAISSIGVTYVLKYLALGEAKGEFVYIDFWNSELRKVKVNKRENCVCCGRRNFEYLEGKKNTNIVKLCGQGAYHIKGSPIDIDMLYKRLSKLGNVKKANGVIVFNSDIIFSDGRAIIKAKDEKVAKSRYNKYISG